MSRFIPACAGNTDGVARNLRVVAVYPRLRGEHLAEAKKHLAKVGLSPLARGTPTRPNSGAPFLRFIPACAGNTEKGKSLLW